MDEPWFFSVRGNHDDELVYVGKRFTDSSMMDANWQDGASDEEISYAVKKLRELPYMMEVPSRKHNGMVGIIHAECPTDDWNTLFHLVVTSKCQYTINTMVFSRTKYKRKDAVVIKNISHVYVGHTVVDNPLTLGNTTYTDTGHVHDGKVTLIEI